MPKVMQYRFRQHDTIGNPSAESDERFLSSCFVDTGTLEVASDSEDPRGIVLGRTGAGKTALLKALTDGQDHAINIDPHNLALSYISNSTVLRFFTALNIDMDPFYRFLWRHVFIVEVLKMHFKLDSEEQKVRVIDNLQYTILRKKTHKDAFKYLNTYGTNFLNTTEERVTELTQKIETDLKGTVEVGIRDFMKMGAEGTQRLTEEQRYEITQHGVEIINNQQNNMLSQLFNALDEDILTDRAKRYFIVIDRLDEDWVDDPTRYRLIRALIEMMRDFNSKVRQAKIVITLRTDLFNRVLRATTGAGFQDEKYRGLCLPIVWKNQQLEELLDKRINELIRNQYVPQQSVTHRNVLPGTVGKAKERQIDYMLDRTLLRPRDIIAFFNICMVKSEGESTIRPQKLEDAEVQYSQGRLLSLCDEWSVQYTCLNSICGLIKMRPSSFRLDSFERHQLDNLCLELLETLETQTLTPSEDVSQLRAYYDSRIDAPTLRSSLAQILYRVGAVGLKTAAFRQVTWSYVEGAELSQAEICGDTTVHVHKMLWRALGIVPQ